MKGKRIQSTRDYIPTEQDVFLMDTNVLIKLFYPLDFDSKSGEYSEFFAKILNAKAKLILTSIQLSEFINRCIRIEYNLYCEREGKDIKFKEEYRNTDEYKESMNTIIDIVKSDMFSVFAIENDEFDTYSKDNILRYDFSYDFNDAFLMECALIKNAIVVTDDRDFAGYGTKVKIVTSNQFLMKFQ